MISRIEAVISSVAAATLATLLLASPEAPETAAERSVVRLAAPAIAAASASSRAVAAATSPTTSSTSVRKRPIRARVFSARSSSAWRAAWMSVSEPQARRATPRPSLSTPPATRNQRKAPSFIFRRATTS